MSLFECKTLTRPLRGWGAGVSLCPGTVETLGLVKSLKCKHFSSCFAQSLIFPKFGPEHRDPTRGGDPAK